LDAGDGVSGSRQSSRVAEGPAPAATGTAVDVRQPAEGRRRAPFGLAHGVVPLAWAAAVATALMARPLLPVDETRYASVAWEMWRGGNYLVPHLNGAPYSDKPPLLFWLIAAGWRVIGPVELWARLVGPVCGVASLALTAALARRLWPEWGVVSRIAPIILASTMVWLVYSTLLLFDTLLTVCVLLAVIGLVDVRRGRRGGLALVAIGIGFGVLAKGPVVSLHVLPAMRLAGWCDVRQEMRVGSPVPGRAPLRHSSLALGGATLAGVAIALAWAIPAALAGGRAYGTAIFIGQTAGRVVNSFAHRRPLWWYVPNLLWMLLPWAAWPAVWRSVRRGRRDALSSDAGLRLCAAIVVPALAVFSVVSGKQVHYLLPEIPFVALAIARLAAGAAHEVDDRIGRRVRWIALGAFCVLAVVSVAGSTTLHARYDVRPLATHLSSAEQAGESLAHEGRYSGQYTFLGRLRHPLVEIPTDSVAAWLARHPNGRVVTYSRLPNAHGPGVLEVVRRLGNRFVVVRAASGSDEPASRSAQRDGRIRQ